MGWEQGSGGRKGREWKESCRASLMMESLTASHGHQTKIDSPPYAGNQRLMPVKRDGRGLRASVCIC